MLALLLKAALGLGFLLFVLGTVLFGVAGNWDYWQAWVYLALFGVGTLLITLYLILRDPQLLSGRVKVGVVAEARRSQRVIQALANLFFLLTFLVAALDTRLGWSHMPGAVSLLASGGVAFGLFVIFLTFRENTYSGVTVDVSPGQRLITGGPYRVVRHPMYAGGSLLMFFTPLALGSWVAWPFAVLLIVVIALRLLDEEQVLLASLPGYEDYCRQVRYRLLPYVW